MERAKKSSWSPKDVQTKRTVADQQQRGKNSPREALKLPPANVHGSQPKSGPALVVRTEVVTHSRARLAPPNVANTSRHSTTRSLRPDGLSTRTRIQDKPDTPTRRRVASEPTPKTFTPRPPQGARASGRTSSRGTSSAKGFLPIKYVVTPAKPKSWLPSVEKEQPAFDPSRSPSRSALKQTPSSSPESSLSPIYDACEAFKTEFKHGGLDQKLTVRMVVKAYKSPATTCLRITLENAISIKNKQRAHTKTELFNSLDGVRAKSTDDGDIIILIPIENQMAIRSFLELCGISEPTIDLFLNLSSPQTSPKGSETSSRSQSPPVRTVKRSLSWSSMASVQEYRPDTPDASPSASDLDDLTEELTGFF